MWVQSVHRREKSVLIKLNPVCFLHPPSSPGDSDFHATHPNVSNSSVLVWFGKSPLLIIPLRTKMDSDKHARRRQTPQNSMQTHTTSHSNMSTAVLHIQDNCTWEWSKDNLTKVAIEAAEVPVISSAHRSRRSVWSSLICFDKSSVRQQRDSASPETCKCREAQQDKGSMRRCAVLKSQCFDKRV